MRVTAVLLALVFQILPLQLWSGLVLCLHPDGRGFVESPDDNCCQPCDVGGTHCDTGLRPASHEDDALAGGGHCEDIPLVTCARVMHEEVRGTSDARPDSGIAPATTDAGPAFLDGLLCRGLPGDGRDPPPVALSLLRPVVLRC